jgi:rod shape-determining protein MreD
MWAFIGGILLDLMNGPVFPLGTNALILVLVVLLASLGQADPFHNKLFVPLATVFVATLFYQVMTLGLIVVLGHQEGAFLDDFVRVAMPSAILNTLLMPVAYSFIFWLSERTGRRVRVEW